MLGPDLPHPHAPRRHALHPHAPRRHDWVWLDEHHADEASSHLVTVWRAAGRPFVVARRLTDDPADLIRLGLATPDKQRICLTAPLSGVRETAPAPCLADTIPSAPEAWCQGLSNLDAACRNLGLVAGVYGSLAWGFRSGLAYVGPTSDVDLLFEPSTWEQTERLLAILSEAPAAPRLDGEIILPDGWAVAWRELALRPKTVLLKGPVDVEMRPFTAVREAFA